MNQPTADQPLTQEHYARIHGLVTPAQQRLADIEASVAARPEPLDDDYEVLIGELHRLRATVEHLRR